MAATPTPITAGQKAQLSILNMTDGNGNPVTTVPTGAKVTYTAQDIYMKVTENTDGVTATVQANQPPAANTLSTVLGTMVYTDQFGVVHNLSATYEYSVGFTPGLPLVFSIGSSTPA